VEPPFQLVLPSWTLQALSAPPTAPTDHPPLPTPLTGHRGDVDRPSSPLMGSSSRGRTPSGASLPARAPLLDLAGPPAHLWPCMLPPTPVVHSSDVPRLTQALGACVSSPLDGPRKELGSFHIRLQIQFRDDRASQIRFVI
jgi:hypothetical protein